MKKMISNFQGLVPLTLDRVILHTIVHHSSTSANMPNFIEIEVTFCGWTYVLHVRMDGRTLETGFIRSTRPHNSNLMLTSHDGAKPVMYMIVSCHHPRNFTYNHDTDIVLGSFPYTSSVSRNKLDNWSQWVPLVLRKTLPNTVTIRRHGRKFVLSLLNILPQLKHVSTLSCKISGTVLTQ